MGRDPTKNQTPDLFSTGRLDSPSNNSPEALPGRPSRRTALPKDLPKAIRYLEDQELDRLLRAATEETKRRGRPMPMAEASPTTTPAASSEPIPKQTKSPARPTHQRQIRPAAASLTRGQVKRCAGRLQGRGDTVKDCSTVRLIPIASSHGPLIRRTQAMMSNVGQGTAYACVLPVND
jgi:hypothetical protein